MATATIATKPLVRPAEFIALTVLLSVVAVAAVSWFVRGGGPVSGVETAYMMNADGSDVRPVSVLTGERAAGPAFSPDGRSVVVTIGGGEGLRQPAHLWIIDLASGRRRQLTNGPGRDDLPSWSPDGSKIVYISRDLPLGSGPAVLFTINADGSDLKQVTDRRSDATRAGWSPDSRKLVFGSRQNGPFQLFISNPDGSEAQLLDTGDRAFEPDWSPDGKTIAFMSDRDNNMDIYTVDLASRRVERLTHDLSFDGMPVWSPDGKKLLFISERDRNQNLFVMNADGSNQRQLSDQHALRGFWAPDGSGIIFFGLAGNSED